MDFEGFKNKYQKLPVEKCPDLVKLDPVVSVCVQTYQHAEFIAECLDSILRQKTDFDFEILLGDDASTDGTRQICLEYAEKYPDKIRLFLHHRDNNIRVEGIPTGRFNFLYNLFSAKGKYVAHCEGDDYWTDPLKLQKQVDFLEANSDCVLCHHWQKVAEVDEQGIYRVKEAPTNGHGYFPHAKTQVDAVFDNKLRVKVRTLMFRNCIRTLPDWICEVSFGDVPLSMILGQYGQFGFINEPMAVYRLTGRGLSSVGKEHQDYFYSHSLSWIKIWELGNNLYDGKYSKQALGTINYFYTSMLKRYNWDTAIFFKTLKYSLFESRLKKTDRAEITFNLFKKFSKIRIKRILMGL
jgi:glycosyltransferase involved in cell wall biosynthesis